MLPRRYSAVIALSLAFVLPSCSSSGSPHGKKRAPNSTSAASPAAQGTRVDAATLAKRLETGIGSISSAHFTINAKIAGRAISGTGDQEVDAGKLTALDAKATLPGGLGDVELLVAASQTYAKLPKGLSTGTKPWTAVTASSSNPIVSQLASFTSTALAAASLGNLAPVAGAATDVRDLGPAMTSGIPTTHYRITVDPTRLPADVTANGGLGTASIPADLYVDESGRPIKIRVALSVVGSPTDATIEFSKFGAPVTITAPPADQIATG
ncbi:MAG: hypothetical protein M3Y06_05805 [Actinomycetota bacterium]|nr:hypothetical protein [Actinomycetota bacterium]